RRAFLAFWPAMKADDVRRRLVLPSWSIQPAAEFKVVVGLEFYELRAHQLRKFHAGMRTERELAQLVSWDIHNPDIRRRACTSDGHRQLLAVFRKGESTH